MNKKWFFGWTNIKWFIQEIGFIYTSKESFFSKKRIESSIAFIIGQSGMVWFFYENVEKLTASDAVLWAGAEFAVAGYIVNQIQKEKKQVVEETEESSN
jgi:hypothetical protein